MNNTLTLVAGILLPIIGNMFIIYICFEFMGKVERNIYRGKIYYIIAYIIFTVIASGISFLGNSLLNIISMVIGVILIGNLLYNNSKIYLLYYCIFAVCLFLCDILAMTSVQFIVSVFGVYFTSIEYYQMFLIVSIRLIEYIYTKIIIGVINKRKVSNVTKVQWVSFLVIPFCSLIYVYTLVMYLQLYSGVEEIILFIINIILILVSNIYMTHIFDAISKNNTLQNEVNLYHQQTKLQYQYYDNLEMKYQESRKLIHDIRNHMQSIESLYNMNDTQAGKRYTDDIHQMLNELNQKYYTSNKVLNIILNDKFQVIKNTSVSMDYRIGDINIDFIKDIDITTIFANLLDNAIEAAIEVKDNSYIKIDVDKFNDFIVVNIINSTIGKPVKKGKRFKTTKKNHEGLGIENIKKALQKYEGTIMLDCKDNEFRVNIVIPIN